MERILHYYVRIRSQQQQAQSPARELKFSRIKTGKGIGLFCGAQNPCRM